MPFGLKKNSRATERRTLFINNGSMMLEELISLCDGNCNPIRAFSADQICKATNNFDPSNTVAKDRFSWFRGVIDDRSVLVKKWTSQTQFFEKVYRDIAVSSKTSSHKNFLKLLGCCLEFPHPVLVFEYAQNGALSTRIGVGPDGTLPWNVRLKVAKGIANAVTYLHTAFPRAIVHRDVKPAHVFLDENWTPKLSDFSLSMSIPEGQTYIQDSSVSGTPGYIDPRYLTTGHITEGSDVYGFGILLLVLLTGKTAFVWRPNGPYVSLRDYVTDLHENGQFFEILDPLLLKNIDEPRQRKLSQMEAFLGLSLRCTARNGDNFPKMIEVAKELKRIDQSSDFA